MTFHKFTTYYESFLYILIAEAAIDPNVISEFEAMGL